MRDNYTMADLVPTTGKLVLSGFESHPVINLTNEMLKYTKRGIATSVLVSESLTLFSRI